jgi:hypothetical protein
VLGCALASACGAPLAYPRTAYVMHAGEIGFQLHSNVSTAPGEVHYHERASSGMAAGPEQTQSGNASSPLASSPMWLQAFGVEGSGEGGAAIGLFDGIELGGRLGPQEVGLELRMRILPASSALRGAFSLGPSHRTLLGADGFAGRAGFDFDYEVGADLLLGAYLGYGPKRRTLDVPANLSDGGDPGPVIEQIVIERDELRLSVPLGIALGPSRPRDACIIGLVLEWTLAAHDPHLHCADCSDTVALDSFKQSFALLITVGLQAARPLTTSSGAEQSR